MQKQRVTVTEMAEMCELSRARFYQLLAKGFFPTPQHDDHSNRPYYDIDTQQKCLRCKDSGLGADGSARLFYSITKPRQRR